MKPTSAPGHRGTMPWHMLLLTASLLTFWSPPTTAQEDLKILAPPNATEGEDVLLLAYNVPENFRNLAWYKSESGNHIAELKANSMNGYDVSINREGVKLYQNGSLLIQNLTLMDAGIYRIEASTAKESFESITTTLHVRAQSPKPHVKANNSSPLENEPAVVLTCESKIPSVTYRWFINSQPVQPSTWLQLSPDNKTLTVFHITRKDTGPYVCETSNVYQSDPFTLNIPNPPDAPINSFQKHEIFNLSCLISSYPTPQFSLFVGKKHLGSTQTLSIFNLPLKDSGSYFCPVNNQITKLKKSLEIHITVSEPVAQPSIQFSDTNCEDPVVLTCLASDTGVSTRWYFNDKDLQPAERRKLSADNRTLTLEPFLEADEGNYRCEAYNDFRSQRSPAVRLRMKSCLRGPKDLTQRQYHAQKNYGQSNKQLPDILGLKDCCIIENEMSSDSSYPFQVPNKKTKARS